MECLKHKAAPALESHTGWSVNLTNGNMLSWLATRPAAVIAPIQLKAFGCHFTAFVLDKYSTYVYPW